ncbi:MAG: CPBP family intramembrane metalloprotease [Phycisphaerae bacterium]|nr:CPBP family intramembrane metalloprotease [Phycisphaerae bacterium]
MSSKRMALLGLLLLVPAPSIGVFAGMITLPDNVIGKLVFAASKFWILVVPLFWVGFVEKENFSLSRPRNGGFGVAAGLGFLMSLVIVAAYAVFGPLLIDPAGIKSMAAEVGLANRYVYLGGAAYWILVNSVLEEYVWRWFVVKQCRVFMPRWPAIIVSAGCFTIHHIIAMQVYFSWPVTILASMGIFIGGATWSWCYLKYKSIWPGYISHAMVDAAVFGIGYILIFM